MDFQHCGQCENDWLRKKQRALPYGGTLEDCRSVISDPSPYGNPEDCVEAIPIQQAFQMLDQAEQARREFTANVSHELKTPLQSICGYAELLQNGMVKPEDTVPFTARIYREAKRMVGLVEDIISLSHLDEGAKDMDWRRVDLYETAAQAIHSAGLI